MSDDDYKTMRVPTTEWEAARSHKRTHDETWADVLAFYADYREAADRLRAIDTDGPTVEATVTPTLDEDALDGLVADMEGADPEAFAREVARQFDYAALADEVARRVVEDLR